MQKSNFEVEVLVNGKPLKEYMHKGRTHVEGRRETRFSLRLTNNTYSRKLFVPSIDGLSVMDGKDASFDSGGYIVKPWSSITVDGWRISDEEVAEFYFSSPKDSYRKRIGKGNNVGVIGCAVFDEKVNYHLFQNSGSLLRGFSGGSSGIGMPTNDVYLCSASCSSLSKGPSQELGTGWGQTKVSEVVSVNFEREPSPSELIEIYYNTREQLEKMGIDFRKEPLYVTPQSFPGRFCKPPKN